jgi:hypothetical protein
MAAEQVKVLDTVIFRFAALDDEKYEGKLASVLPKCLSMLTRNVDAAVRGKVVELVSSVSSRLAVPSMKACKLPVVALLNLFQTAESTLLANLSLMFVEKGVARMTLAEKTPVLPLLVAGIASHAPQQQSTLLHLFLAIVCEQHAATKSTAIHQEFVEYGTPVAVQPTSSSSDASSSSSTSTSSASRSARYAFVDAPADRAVVLAFLFDVLLYVPLSPVAVATKNDDNTAPPVAPTPPGLSAARVDVLLRNGRLRNEWTGAALDAMKLGVMALLHRCDAGGERLFHDNDVFLHLLVAGSGSAGGDLVTRRGDDAYRRLKQLDVESRGVVVAAMRHFMGETDDTFITDVRARRLAASTAVKLRLIPLFVRSQTAADLATYTLKVVFDCFFKFATALSAAEASGGGAAATVATGAPFAAPMTTSTSTITSQTRTRVRLAGLRLLAHVIDRADARFLPNTLISVYVRGLQKLRKEIGGAATPAVSTSSSSSSPALASSSLSSLEAEAKGMCYSLIGRLAHRSPDAFNDAKGVELFVSFFDALATEGDATVQQSIHSAVSLFASAFATVLYVTSPTTTTSTSSTSISTTTTTTTTAGGSGVGDGSVRLRLQELLRTYVCDSENRKVRLAALQCSNRLFLFSSPVARHMCLHCLSDAAAEVRNEAANGLTFRPRGDAAAAAAAKAASASAYTGVAEGVVDADASPAVRAAAKAAVEKAAQKKAADAKAKAMAARNTHDSYPDFVKFITYVCAAPRMRVSGDVVDVSIHVGAGGATAAAADAAAPVDARVLKATLSFAHECLLASAHAAATAAAATAAAAAAAAEAAAGDDDVVATGVFTTSARSGARARDIGAYVRSLLVSDGGDAAAVRRFQALLHVGFAGGGKAAQAAEASAAAASLSPGSTTREVAAHCLLSLTAAAAAALPSSSSSSSSSLLLATSSASPLRAFIARYAVADRLHWLCKHLLTGGGATAESVASLLAVVVRHGEGGGDSGGGGGGGGAVVDGGVAVDVLEALLARFAGVLDAKLSPPSTTTTTALLATNAYEADDDTARLGAILGTGVVVAHCVRTAALPSPTSSSLSSSVVSPQWLTMCTQRVVSFLCGDLARRADLAAAACVSLGRCGVAGPLPLPSLVAGDDDDDAGDGDADKNATTGAAVPSSEEAAAAEKKRRTRAAAVAAARQPTPTMADGDVGADECVKRLAHLTFGTGRREARLAERAVDALGRLCVGDRSPLLLKRAFAAIQALAPVKHEEVHFAVGRAVCMLGTGWPLAAADDDDDDDGGGGEGAVNGGGDGVTMHVDEAATSNDDDDDDNDVSSRMMDRLLDKIVTTHLDKGSVVVRSSACTWLLCVVRFVGKHSAVQRRLSTIQAAFSRALSESNQVSSGSSVIVTFICVLRSLRTQSSRSICNSVSTIYSSCKSAPQRAFRSSTTPATPSTVRNSCSRSSARSAPTRARRT